MRTKELRSAVAGSVVTPTVYSEGGQVGSMLSYLVHSSKPSWGKLEDLESLRFNPFIAQKGRSREVKNPIQVIEQVSEPREEPGPWVSDSLPD